MLLARHVQRHRKPGVFEGASVGWTQLSFDVLAQVIQAQYAWHTGHHLLEDSVEIRATVGGHTPHILPRSFT
jgi:hypothetical protein